jgi:hypothetical protein
LGGYTVLPSGVSATNYIVNKVLQTRWGGARYAIRQDLEVEVAYARASQNDYTNYAVKGTAACGSNKTAPALGFAPQGANHSTCAGNIQALSGVIDWRQYKRIDVYLGVMYSQVTGGLASGYLHNHNIASTTGVRLTF